MLSLTLLAYRLSIELAPRYESYDDTSNQRWYGDDDDDSIDMCGRYYEELMNRCPTQWTISARYEDVTLALSEYPPIISYYAMLYHKIADTDRYDVGWMDKIWYKFYQSYYIMLYYSLYCKHQRRSNTICIKDDSTTWFFSFLRSLHWSPCVEERRDNIKRELICSLCIADHSRDSMRCVSLH